MTVLRAPAVTIVPGGPVALEVAAPPSKSVTNRLLVLAALADGSSRLVGPGDSDDARAMRRAVQALGATVSDQPGAWLVRGTGGRLSVPAAPVDAALSGTTLRFVAAVAALAPRPVTVTGRAPLRRRPVAPLIAALRTLGATATATGGYPPVRVGGGLRGGAVTVDAAGSSQYVSALLLAAPYASADVTVAATGLAARAYVDLTVEAMRRWGADVTAAGPATWAVVAGRRYASREEVVEHDASAAAHLFALAAATGGTVTVTNAAPTRQPDAAVPALLGRMGASVTSDGDRVTVRGPRQLAPLEADLASMPDQVTTLAALCALAEGRSLLRGAAVARGHETDRLAALAAELRRLGAGVEELPDGLAIAGGRLRGPATLRTHDDHRLAMAFAAVGARVPGVTIADPGCVAKTYPGFWRDLAAAGVDLAPAERDLEAP